MVIRKTGQAGGGGSPPKDASGVLRQSAKTPAGKGGRTANWRRIERLRELEELRRNLLEVWDDDDMDIAALLDDAEDDLEVLYASVTGETDDDLAPDLVFDLDDDLDFEPDDD